MTQTQYLKALQKLGLSKTSKETMAVLGLRLSQVKRLANGTQEPTALLAKLLKMYLRYGIPDDL